jgi:hypothetical protein
MRLGTSSGGENLTENLHSTKNLSENLSRTETPWKSQLGEIFSFSARFSVPSHWSHLPIVPRVIYICSHSVSEPHLPVLRNFVKSMKSPNDFSALSSETRHTSIIRKKPKKVHVPVMSHEKTTFTVMGFKPRTFNIRVSDALTRPYCSNNVKIYHFRQNFQLEYIHWNLKTPAAGHDNGIPARFYTFCTCQLIFRLISCPRHRI